MAVAVRGTAATGEVRVGGELLRLGPSLRLRNHSPTGFSWGYYGSGPAQLALALLLHAGMATDDALECYQEFKTHVIAQISVGTDFELPYVEVKEWAKAAEQRLDSMRATAAMP